VVQPGVQEELRDRLSWLPDHEHVAFAFRETAHGVKLLYASGHMLEFAVFDPDELYLGRFNRFRVLLDRADLRRRMDEIVRTTSEWSASQAPGDAFLIGQVLTGVLIAHGRWMRGEKLSAREFLINMAVTNFVQLVERHVPASSPGVLDNLSSLRRFELVYGTPGAVLNEVLDRPLPAAAAGLLDLADRELSDRMPQFPAAALEAVRRRLR
jgi:hypothetical protein